MAKAKSKTSSKVSASVRRGVKHSAAQRATKETRRAQRSPPSLGLAAKSDTKHDKVLAMLRSAGGTTIAAVMKETSWQQHSVRGFLAGVVRKRLKLDLISTKTDKGRIYRIKDKRPGSDKGAANPA